jgi:hypothetical protein
LSYVNNISVSSGSSITVVVGQPQYIIILQ